jgi:hypothetical protein
MALKRTVKTYFNHLDEDELRDELARLYNRFPVLRAYYDMELADDSKPLIDKVKLRLRKTFFPTRGRGKRGRSLSRKLIKEFSLIAVHPKDVVEMHFYRAELMAEYIDARRIDSDAFHTSTVKAYADACALAEREVLLDYFGGGAQVLANYFEEKRRSRYHSFWPTYRTYWGGPD